jgi:hypothetical protein
MIKQYLLKVTLLCLLLSCAFNQAWAQYAIGGSAGANLANAVYWLTWDKNAPGTTLISAPAASNASNIIAGTYVWQFSPTVRITAVVSNLVFSLPMVVPQLSISILKSPYLLTTCGQM